MNKSIFSDKDWFILPSMSNGPRRKERQQKELGELSKAFDSAMLYGTSYLQVDSNGVKNIPIEDVKLGKEDEPMTATECLESVEKLNQKTYADGLDYNVEKFTLAFDNYSVELYERITDRKGEK